jgi:hypothetical protein
MRERIEFMAHLKTGSAPRAPKAPTPPKHKSRRRPPHEEVHSAPSNFDWESLRKWNQPRLKPENSTPLIDPATGKGYASKAAPPRLKIASLDRKRALKDSVLIGGAAASGALVGHGLRKALLSAAEKNPRLLRALPVIMAGGGALATYQTAKAHRLIREHRKTAALTQGKIDAGTGAIGGLGAAGLMGGSSPRLAIWMGAGALGNVLRKKKAQERALKRQLARR